jgi:hypothetical protein
MMVPRLRGEGSSRVDGAEGAVLGLGSEGARGGYQRGKGEERDILVVRYYHC